MNLELNKDSITFHSGSLKIQIKNTDDRLLQIFNFLKSTRKALDSEYFDRKNLNIELHSKKSSKNVFRLRVELIDSHYFFYAEYNTIKKDLEVCDCEIQFKIAKKYKMCSRLEILIENIENYRVLSAHKEKTRFLKRILNCVDDDFLFFRCGIYPTINENNDIVMNTCKIVDGEDIFFTPFLENIIIKDSYQIYLFCKELKGLVSLGDFSDIEEFIKNNLPDNFLHFMISRICFSIDSDEDFNIDEMKQSVDLLVSKIIEIFIGRSQILPEANEILHAFSEVKNIRDELIGKILNERGKYEQVKLMQKKEESLEENKQYFFEPLFENEEKGITKLDVSENPYEYEFFNKQIVRYPRIKKIYSGKLDSEEEIKYLSRFFNS